MGLAVLHTLLFIVIAVAVIGGRVHADGLGPGPYHGYVAKDRWGRHVFHTGPYHLFIADGPARELAKFEGRPIRLNVTKMWQEVNPGGAVIEAIGEVVPSTPALIYEAVVVENRVRSGEGIELRLTVRNRSKKLVELKPWDLAVATVTNSLPTVPGWRDPDGRAYWYYGDGVSPRHDRTTFWKIGCHVTEVAWNPERFVAGGENVQVGNRQPSINGSDRPIILEPGGFVTFEMNFGEELPPGEYEALFYQPTGNFSSPAGPSSARIPFDIVKTSAMPP